MERRDFLEVLVVSAVASRLMPLESGPHASSLTPSVSRPSPRASGLVAMTVYKSPTCGCCKEWVTHVQKNGFAPKVIDLDDLTKIKKDAGVPDSLQSCHTALVGAYVVEGHVPADLVQKMLSDKPKILGLAVAGMVVGSPGMEQGNRKQPYQVTAFTKDGKTSVYARR